MTLLECDLCTDDETRWGIDKDPQLAEKLLGFHKARQHGLTDQVVSNEAIADLLYSDPKNARAKAVIEECVRQDAESHGGHVNQNRVRELIPGWVNPRLVGSVYSVLIRRGTLMPDGSTRNLDGKGRNKGKPLTTYRYVSAA